MTRKVLLDRFERCGSPVFANIVVADGDVHPEPEIAAHNGLVVEHAEHNPSSPDRLIPPAPTSIRFRPHVRPGTPP
jgi:hypothetical protein